MSIIVYHGGTEIVRHPDCLAGRDKLDFGKGFYVTDRREQAERWAKQMAQRRGMPALLNIYRLEREKLLKEYQCRIFPAYNADWLHFVVRCRSRYDPSIEYDYVEGGVANDRVINTVDLFVQGFLSESAALGRLAQHLPNNQMCLLNQELTDKFLIYERTETIK